METTLQSLPSLVAGRTVLGIFQQTMLDAPCHAIEEEGRTCHFRAGIVCITNQAGVPESVVVLAFQQCLAHQEKVFFQFLVFFALHGQLVHAAYQGSIHPAVASAPVAVLSVLLLIWSHIVLVAPPEAFLHVEASSSTFVARPAVALHSIVEIALVLGLCVHLDIDRHGHLDGVNPCPIVVSASCHLLLQIFLGGFKRAFFGQEVILNIGLLATLVVGIGCLGTVARCPLMEVCPL